MTPSTKSERKSKAHIPISIIVILLILTPTFLFPKEISRGVFDGIMLSVKNVIPSIFPFLVIADVLYALSEGEECGRLGKLFSRLFHLPPSCLGTFACALVCGFPIGVKLASELYEKGALTKKQAEHLIGFSNNPSTAFLVSGVGLGIYGSVGVGAALFFSVSLAAVFVGLFFRTNDKISQNTPIIIKQKFNFVESVRNAGFSSLAISSYIIFFSALSGLVVHLVGDGLLGLFGTMLSEVSSSVSLIGKSSLLPREWALSLTAAALGFSGFSVHLQARSLASKKLSFAKYYLMKITQGVISGALMLAAATLFGL